MIDISARKFLSDYLKEKNLRLPNSAPNWHSVDPSPLYIKRSLEALDSLGLLTQDLCEQLCNNSEEVDHQTDWPAQDMAEVLELISSSSNSLGEVDKEDLVTTIFSRISDQSLISSLAVMGTEINKVMDFQAFYFLNMIECYDTDNKHFRELQTKLIFESTFGKLTEETLESGEFSVFVNSDETGPKSRMGPR